MNKEIKEKVENKRREIRQLSERLRAEARAKHICAYCGKINTDSKKIYCDTQCAYMFSKKYDFSQSSQILKDYKQELKEEYEEKHPRSEPDPWSVQAAKKEYTCAFCHTAIGKGEKYEKYTRLPGFDDWFDDAPYETFPYHLNCTTFESVLIDNDLLEPEAIDLEEIRGILFVIALRVGKPLEELSKDIARGDFPPNSVLEQISKEDIDFEEHWWGDSDHSGFRYLYFVQYKDSGREKGELHYIPFKPEDPVKTFTEYHQNRDIDEFERIISVDMTAIPIPEKKVEVVQ